MQCPDRKHACSYQRFLSRGKGEQLLNGNSFFLKAWKQEYKISGTCLKVRHTVHCTLRKGADSDRTQDIGMLVALLEIYILPRMRNWGAVHRTAWESLIGDEHPGLQRWEDQHHCRGQHRCQHRDYSWRLRGTDEDVSGLQQVACASRRSKCAEQTLTGPGIRQRSLGPAKAPGCEIKGKQQRWCLAFLAFPFTSYPQVCGQKY